MDSFHGQRNQIEVMHKSVLVVHIILSLRGGDETRQNPAA